MRTWSKAQAGFWDRAVQGNSALRIALMRSIWIEAQVEMKNEVAIALLDLEGFYDSLRPGAVVVDALGRGFSCPRPRH